MLHTRHVKGINKLFAVDTGDKNIRGDTAGIQNLRRDVCKPRMPLSNTRIALTFDLNIDRDHLFIKDYPHNTLKASEAKP